MPKYWLIKSEPSVYSYAHLVKERRTAWTGVRNFEARNNLRAMAPGDLCLYYHSGTDKAVVGVAKVLGRPGPDPTAPGEDWASVEVGPHAAFPRPVTLAEVKARKDFAAFPLVTHSRLSVAAVSAADFQRVSKLAKTKAP